MGWGTRRETEEENQSMLVLNEFDERQLFYIEVDVIEFVRATLGHMQVGLESWRARDSFTFLELVEVWHC